MSYSVHRPRSGRGPRASLVAALALHASLYFAAVDRPSSLPAEQTKVVALRSLTVELASIEMPRIERTLPSHQLPREIADATTLGMSTPLQTTQGKTHTPSQALNAAFAKTAAPDSSAGQSTRETERTATSERPEENTDALSARDKAGTGDKTGSEVGSATGADTGGLALASHHAGSARRSAQLIKKSHRCADLFPYQAAAKLGFVTVELGVDRSGAVRDVEALTKTPQNEAFSVAAKLCAHRLRFIPARDERGQAVDARAVVRLRFERSS